MPARILTCAAQILFSGGGFWGGGGRAPGGTAPGGGGAGGPGALGGAPARWLGRGGGGPEGQGALGSTSAGCTDRRVGWLGLIVGPSLDDVGMGISIDVGVALEGVHASVAALDALTLEDASLASGSGAVVDVLQRR